MVEVNSATATASHSSIPLSYSWTKLHAEQPPPLVSIPFPPPPLAAATALLSLLGTCFRFAC